MLRNNNARKCIGLDYGFKAPSNNKDSDISKLELLNYKKKFTHSSTDFRLSLLASNFFIKLKFA